MPRGLKIITAVLLGIVGLASVGLIWLRDASSRPEYCDRCHAVTGQYYGSWASSDFLAAAHARSAIPCQQCHPRTIGNSLREIVTYVKKDYASSLWGENHPNEECLQCHAHGSYERLIERTSDYAIDGELHNPHDPHAGLAGVDQTPFKCSDCHNMHKESPGISYCYSCHHTRTLVSCKECHQ